MPKTSAKISQKSAVRVGDKYCCANSVMHANITVEPTTFSPASHFLML